MREKNHPYHDLEEIFRAGIQRVAPKGLIRASLSVENNRLKVGSNTAALDLDLDEFDKIYVLGAGKATAAMAAGIEEVLGERISEGLIVVKYGHTEDLRSIRIVEAGHPVPDENGVLGAEAIEELARRADEKTLVVSLISGGGSALLPAPFRRGDAEAGIELSLKEKQEVTQSLLACGAAIQEINCIRKHISRLKGGRLAELLYPARTLNLILSDVVGDRLDTIASGLTVADATSYGEALQIVAKYSLADRLPPNVLELFKRGAAGQIEETPKPGNPVFEKVTNVLIGTNYTALGACAEKAAALGYSPVLLCSRIIGEAREVAKVFAALALDVKERGLLAEKPVCLLAGGETTVTIRGKGRGGRNQELALSFLAEIEAAGAGVEDIYFLSAATDGNDGPTDAAGAFASLQTVETARSGGLDIGKYLKDNDSYHFFESSGHLLKTGPTNTNVCDLQICLVY